MKTLLLILILSASAHADVTVDLARVTGTRTPTKETPECGEGAYAYLLRNIAALDSIVLGAGDAISIVPRGGGAPIRLTRTAGTRGFLDVSDALTLFFAVDLPPGKPAVVTIGTIRRAGKDVCVERWRGEGK